MKNCITVSLVIVALLFCAGPATAKTFYLRDGSTIEYKRVWKQGGLIYLLINRDTLVAFLPGEVDQRRTLKAAGMKRFPCQSVKKRRPASPPERAKADAP